MKPAPRWFSDFQADFGGALRTPLNSTSGTFRAEPHRYPEPIRQGTRGAGNIAAEERLAVYNRQYWYRLFGVLQSAFPLTARLVGHFRFNELASVFLLEHPPQGWNIEDASNGFEEHLTRTLPERGVELPASHTKVERAALVEAAHIDAAWRRIFFAPDMDPFHPSAEDAARLLSSRLVPAGSVAVFGEHRALLELRRRLADLPGEKPVPLPPRLSAPVWWALVRKPAGIGQLPLAPLEARLFTLMREHPVGRALALLEAECPEAERAALPQNARQWLARSVELGFWTGLAPSE